MQCLRKLEYYIRSIKKWYFKQKCQASEKYVHFYALNTWLGLLLHELLHQWRHGDNQPVALLSHHWLWKLHTPLFLQTLRPWFPNEMQNLLSSEKRTLDHWATVQFFFSLAQVRCFWPCFCFRSGLVALFLKMSERGDSWCTDSSFSSLLVKLSQVFESALLDSILKLAFIPVACAHFPAQFLPSSQLCINMLWYSTPWTATPFSNDPLWLTLFVERVPMIVFWTIAKSAVFLIIVVSKNKRYLQIMYGWSFIETQIFWDTDFWLALALSSNHQN